MLSSPAASSSLFASLPTRPPTPPRDISKDVDEAFQFLQEGHHDADATGSEVSPLKISADTPSREHSTSSQLRASTIEKRVDFSPNPTFHEPFDRVVSLGSRPHKQIPPKHQTKPLKSILKATSEFLPATPDDLESRLGYFSPQKPGSFARMLQSVLAQLTSQSRDDRRDAYLAINGALKHYEGIPEPQALCEKMPFVQQFISRDLTWKDSTGRLDTAIVTQALQLTLALLANPQTEPALDDDFRDLLIERSMAVVEQKEMHKGLYKLHMYLLSQQRFRPHILTASRADKLLGVLQGTEDRCSGNSIVAYRLVVYMRLLKQVPSVMLNRMRDWIEHVLHGMLSSIQDIRSRAIETCTQAGLILGEQPHAAKLMYELAEKEGDEGGTYGDYLNKRLKEMSGNKEVAEWVPQIWAAIILLFRCKRRPVDKWPCFKDWLATIQRSLNSPDTEVKYQANIAWNKLVYAVMPGAETTDSMRSMLRIPIMAGLEKRGSDRVSQQHRQIALDSYCNLLHYGLRPGLTYEELDRAWDLYVDPLITRMSSHGGKQRHHACCVLQGLMKRGTSIWNKNAVNEQGTIKPEDLPRLESRWIRSRLSKLMNVLEPIILSGMYAAADVIDPANTCWRFLLEAIAEAGSQEVKTSIELREAMAQLTNFFRRVWNQNRKPQDGLDGDAWLERFHMLLETAIHQLGPAHFAEDILSKTGQDDLEAAPTPSHRTAKHSITSYPAFVFLFELYYHPPAPIRISGLYEGSAATLLRLLSGAKGSPTGALALLHRALQFGASMAGETHVSGQLWNLVASEATTILQVERTATPQREAQAMGNGLRSVINILLHGLRHTGSVPTCQDRVEELYRAACLSAKDHANHGGVVLGVMEPFAKSAVDLLDEVPTTSLARICKVLLEECTWPKSRTELDGSRKALWTVSLDIPRTTVFNPFEHVYGLLNGLLVRSYDALEHVDRHACEALCSLLESMVSFLQRAPAHVLPDALRQIQVGSVNWIEDPRRLLFPTSNNTVSATQSKLMETLAKCAIGAWSAIVDLIHGLPRKDSAILKALESLFCAGFSSISKDIVNKTIEFWNTTFGSSSNLQYTSRLESVLRVRQCEVELKLPDFPACNPDAETPDLPAFAELQQYPPNTLEVANIAPESKLASIPEQMKEASNEGIVSEAEITFDEASEMQVVPTVGTNALQARLDDDDNINLAPIEPITSMPAEASESQLSAGNQPKALKRQRGDAQMCPDLSSPIAETDLRSRSIAKRLDFISGPAPEGDGVMTTPTAVADTNLMSDDVPSSPTPRSKAILLPTTNVTDYNNDDDGDDDDTICDPPSSPPRVDDTHAAQFLPEAVHKHSALLPTDTATDELHLHHQNENGDNEQQTVSVVPEDAPSDTQTHMHQLAQDAIVSTAKTGILEATVMNDSTSSTGNHHLNNEPPVVTEAAHQIENSEVLEMPTHEQQDYETSSPLRISRVQDSMIGLAHDQAEHPASTDSGAETGMPRARGRPRRKRSSEVVHASEPAKKRVKSLTARSRGRFRGRDQDDDDADTDDEIVVASSQRDNTPETADQNGSQEQSQPQMEAVNSVELADRAPPPEEPVKRKRGRPRKSESQLSSQTAISHVKTRKRRSSVISFTNTRDQHSTSGVDETPAGPRTRKSARLTDDTIKRSNSRSKHITNRSSSPSGTPFGRIASREVNENIIEDGESNVWSPSQQLTQEEAAAIEGRRIAQPKSIISRLRGVLADCKNMVFGSSQEERIFDDVLFEIRREVHEAGSRMRHS